MDIIKAMKPAQDEANLRMDEQKKYFTPSIEDIRVGYEGEALLPSTDNWKCDTWTSFVIDKDKISHYSPWSGDLSHLDEVLDKIRLNEIRTPYLTKEKIEAEGWKQEARLLLADFKNDPSKDENCYLFTKGDKFMIFEDEIHKIVIYKQTRISVDCNIEPEIIKTSYFNGECKDINTFRYISKLLNIK